MLKPTDGMAITQDTVLAPGVYLLPSGITIAADQITIDGNGAVLVGVGRMGCGITINDHKNINIKNIRIMEYYHGIYVRNSQGVNLLNCQITSTSETTPNTIFLNIWNPAEEAHPGGILLWNVSDSQVNDNDLQHQLAGLLAYDCHKLSVRANLANYCSGWGFLINNTSESIFEANYADYCCRYEPRGERIGHMGADAAGFLIINSSCRNIFKRNFARLGGDGFFLAGLTPNSEPVGCDDNLFQDNDGSYSPNIAFEATFSRGNIYRNNFANNCNYGFWCGFSRDFILEQNQINGNHQAGIAVENGIGFMVTNNTFQDNCHGVLLWSKHIPGFARPVPDNNTSYNWLIKDNTFTRNVKAIRIAANQDHGIRPLKSSGEWGLPAPKPHDHIIRGNQIVDNRIGIELLGVEGTFLQDNNFKNNVEADFLH
jgi:parallel beta-helix repeat protein